MIRNIVAKSFLLKTFAVVVAIETVVVVAIEIVVVVVAVAEAAVLAAAEQTVASLLIFQWHSTATCLRQLDKCIL